MGEVKKIDVSRGSIFFRLIFGLLTIPKCDLVYVEKAMFQSLAWHSQLILGLWNYPKCDLDEVEKAMIQVVECHFEVIFC